MYASRFRLAVQTAAQKQQQRSAATKSGFVGVVASVGAATLCMPHFWFNLASMSNMVGNDSDRDHKQANKVQETLRAARRGSLKEFKEAYYGKADEHDYKAGVYWDRFNNNTIVDQKHNPNAKEKSGSSKPIGLYDTNGVVDTSRSSANEWMRTKSANHETALAHKV